MIKVDLTRKGDPINENLLRQYEVRGVPTVVFLDKEGKELSQLRVLSYVPPSDFLNRMATITKAGL